MQKHPFKPIVFKDSEILILGSFPSLKSFENNFYYAHPKNQFWKILSQISGYPINNKDQKIWLLKELKLSLWDVVASCNRKNSLDSNLKDIVPNDIRGFLQEHKSIKKIAFTSKLAQKIFNKEFKDITLEQLYLPSPSPAYAAMSFEDKCKIYKEKLL
jgi:hypoxanthine-DNA glycosylase